MTKTLLICFLRELKSHLHGPRTDLCHFTKTALVEIKIPSVWRQGAPVTWPRITPLWPNAIFVVRNQISSG